MTKRSLVLVLLAGALALVASSAALVVNKTDPTKAFTVLDELDTPPSWQLAHTATSPSVLLLSWAARYYIVDAEPEAATEQARAFMTSAGWPVQSGAWKDCNTNGPSGPMTCFLRADRGAHILHVVVWDRDRSIEPDYRAGDDDFSIPKPDRLVVRVLIHY